ncbi:erythroblast NAD(P)(+)--arginine ADP-ribosyltransferase-like [Clarias gariepinus]|uniref:erythroblast NAD(P)(+)--arginine ADP-ribosyltransferase-like n=1 Tax=Clarias gariepinus TaxID=13013 RepID=UPI00234DEF0F|nr:erythroblast NAD(P)(+)--arginine ADP-ribosyltransferase-like [Clarias gariepinus]
MKEAVKFSTILSNVVIALIIISADCYAGNVFRTPKPLNLKILNLDMANNSVDDQFINCFDQTYNRIKESILPQELESNPLFKETWMHFSNISDIFTRIIKVYTTSKDLYSYLNNNVSSGRENYIRTFNYKAFHFLLTHAIQKYKVRNCTDVFRKTTVRFNINVLDQEMRFGRFASTSLRDDITTFGSSSCFKINTCFGANIANMSEFPKEEEVLIPPFEKFRITNITTAKNKLNCSVIYTLQSTGNFSNMNCELINTNVRVAYKRLF